MMRAVAWGTLLSVVLSQSHLLSFAATTQAISNDWYQVKARGQNVGYLAIRSFREPNAIITEMENVNALSRLGDAFTTGSQSRFVERASDGQPIRFSYRYLLSNQEAAQAQGAVEGKTVTVQLQQVAHQSTQTTQLEESDFSFPTGEKIRQLFKAHYTDPEGSRFAFQTLYLALAPQVVRAQAQVGAEEQLPLPDGSARTFRRFAILAPQNPANVVYEWRDAEGKLYKAYSERQKTELIRLPLEALGQSLSVKRTDPKVLDTLSETRIRANERIRNPRNTQEAVYELTLAGGNTPNQVEAFRLPEDTRQSILRTLPWQGLVLRVTPHEPVDALAPYPIPTESRYLKSSPYLQSTDPEILNLARKLTQKEPRAYFAARILQRWVYDNISQKDLSQGFASAKETLAQKTGDCTEHAVLLAALARAIGIPSRVAVGVLYLPGEGDGPGYFTYHLWTEVYIGTAKKGEWIALDAANPEPVVDATHIKLSDSDLAEANAPIALAESVSDFMFRLRINVLQATAPGATLLSLSTTNADPLALAGSNTLRWDLRDLQPTALETYRLEGLQGDSEGTLEGLVSHGFDRLLAGDAPQGRALLQKALTKAKNPLELYHLGERLAGLELFQTANEAFDRALEKDPSFQRFVLAWRQDYFPATLLTEALENRYFQAKGSEWIQQDRSAAKRAYQEILTEKPGFALAALRLGRLAMAEKDALAAQKAFQDFQRLAPRDPRGAEGLAQAAMALRQYPQALVYFKSALQLAKRQTSLQGELLAQDLSAQVQLAEGQALLARSAQDPAGWLALGHGLLQQKRYNQALEAINQALRLKPYQANAMTDKLEALVGLSQWRVLPGFAQVLRQKGISSSARVQGLLGYAAMRQRQYPTAQIYLRKAIALNPKDAAPYETLSKVYQRIGKLSAAQNVLRQGLAQTNQASLRVSLAQLLSSEHPAEAKQLLETVLRQDPTQVQAYLINALMDLRQNQLDSAKTALWNALTVEPFNVEALTLLGDCYALEENQNEALYQYRKALKTEPGNAKANQALALLIDQFQLGLKKPLLPLQLNEDETDYLLQVKQQSEATETLSQSFKNSMNALIDHQEGFLEEKANTLPLLEKIYTGLLAQYRVAQQITPPRRFQTLHQQYCTMLYSKAAMLHGTYDWLNGLMTPAGFSEFKQDPAFQVYLQSKDLSEQYQQQYQGLLKRLDPAVSQQFNLSSLETEGQ